MPNPPSRPLDFSAVAPKASTSTHPGLCLTTLPLLTVAGPLALALVTTPVTTPTGITTIPVVTVDAAVEATMVFTPAVETTAIPAVSPR